LSFCGGRYSRLRDKDGEGHYAPLDIGLL
jgi:hypothetical protein